ncbi:hypothetical protein ACP3T3_18405 [Chryseobacterium sp. CBSDS_008]|uniref:hypothetical protein n=1 Tax=Chryseobacterium sp. CBSDS_008 TaxID=3415265 RepID=UPI003CF4E87C
MKNKKREMISKKITNVKMKKPQKDGLVFITGGLLAYHCSRCTWVIADRICRKILIAGAFHKEICVLYGPVWN